MVPAEIAPGNAAKVTGLISNTKALGNGTPTGDAINKATAYLKSRNASNQFIVLATDGQPSCPSGGDAAQAFAVQAITAAKAAGFPTYVIGVVDPVADKSTPPRLNAMAEAGGSASMWQVLLLVKTQQWGNQSQMAEALGITGATLTHHLNAMELSGLITRTRDPKNRRIHQVELTEQGQALFFQLLTAARAHDARLRTGLAEEEIAQLGHLLNRLHRNITG
jgi:MarR family transcriptional regulator for hemolysin